ncbi:ABC transporter substrate-binding protein [Paenibacillus hodogayensis]|uniref:ABC transporter substrate-binding protein n=1 Tax=Paenibacillus hodogayensis TaxID=279208 RepID=A0ABV5VYX0_9BACL
MTASKLYSRAFIGFLLIVLTVGCAQSGKNGEAAATNASRDAKAPGEALGLGEGKTSGEAKAPGGALGEGQTPGEAKAPGEALGEGKAPGGAKAPGKSPVEAKAPAEVKKPGEAEAEGGSKLSADAKTAQAAQAATADQAKPFLSFQDDAGRAVTLAAKPRKIVVLSPQLLDLLYAVDGTAIAKTTTSGGGTVPEKAKELADVGGITTVNAEKLLALQPDLVIGSTSFHRELAGMMDASKIPFALLGLSTYKDLKEKTPLFGKIAGTESKASEELAKLDDRIAALTAKLPDRSPSFIMLNVTPNSVSVQRSNTVGLEVASMLNMKNVAETLQASQSSQSTAPYSMEKLVELNPDYVFILIHGARADGEKKIQSDLAGQPAWASLRAVKENRMAILPSDLLLSNPGFRLNESVDYLAKLVYPETYGNGGQ